MNKYIRNGLFFSITVALGGFIFGLDAAVISGTIDYIIREFGLDEVQIGTVVSAPGFGVLFALLIAGYFSDKFGRKKALLLIATLYLVSAVCSAFAPSYFTLVAARFLGGLAFTSLSIASMYIGEIAPAKYRGVMVSMNQFNGVIGLSGAYFINYFILKAAQSDGAWAANLGLEHNAWRWMLGSEIIPALVWLLLLFLVPESPRWLVFNQKRDAARNVLKKLMPEQEIERELSSIEASMHKSHDSRSMLQQVRELFGKRMKMIVIIGFLIATVQPLTGINAVLFYAPKVFELIGGGTDAAFINAAWGGLVSVVFACIALFCVDVLGRRPMMLWGLAWLILSLGICSYGFHKATYTLTPESLIKLESVVDAEKLEPIVGRTYTSDIAYKAALNEILGDVAVRENNSLLIQQAVTLNASLIIFGLMSFLAAFQFSAGPIMWVMFSEIFPTAIRGIAIPLFALYMSILSFFVQKYFPSQLAAMGGSGVFLFYAGITAAGFLLLLKFLPETKNKSIEEIEEELTA